MITNILLIMLFVSCGSFPDKNKIDEKLQICKNSGCFEELLVNIRNPKDKMEDELSEYAIKQLAQIYNKNSNEEILSALDKIQIDGGFANTFCGVYLEINHDKKFKEHYLKNKKALSKCIGITISEQGIENYLK